MRTIAFEVPSNRTRSISNFAKYIKKHYNAQTAYYPDRGIIEVQVDELYYNSVRIAAQAYDYLYLNG